MTRTVTLRPQAREDLLDAYHWYEDQRSGLGNEFLAAAAQIFLILEESPERFPVYYNGFRRAMLDRFPYKVFYRIENTSIIVFRILHAARDHARLLRRRS